jgi:hypothetical protein
MVEGRGEDCFRYLRRHDDENREKDISVNGVDCVSINRLGGVPPAS